MAQQANKVTTLIRRLVEAYCPAGAPDLGPRFVTLRRYAAGNLFAAATGRFPTQQELDEIDPAFKVKPQGVLNGGAEQTAAKASARRPRVDG